MGIKPQGLKDSRGQWDFCMWENLCNRATMHVQAGDTGLNPVCDDRVQLNDHLLSRAPMAGLQHGLAFGGQHEN